VSPDPSATEPGAKGGASDSGGTARWMPRPVGAARVGRDRRHAFPGRRRRIAPTFTEDEYAAVVVAARGLGLTPSGFCAMAALAAAGSGMAIGTGAAGQREALAAVQAELAELRTSIVRVGTNLNQAVAALNSTGEAPVWLRHAVDRCARVLALVDDAASAVHRRLP
jgi:hypothetical protein